MTIVRKQGFSSLSTFSSENAASKNEPCCNLATVERYKSEDEHNISQARPPSKYDYMRYLRELGLCLVIKGIR